MKPRKKSISLHPIFTFAPILLLALALRIWDLDARSIWFDEAVEFWLARPPLSEIPSLGSSYLQPLLYSFLLHLWIQISSTLFWMRLLSVLFSVGSVLGVMLWGFRRFASHGAILDGLIMSFLPSEIRYAQDMSEYALLVFGLTWAIVFLDFAVTTPGWKYWLMWGFFSLIALYSHYGAGIPLATAAGLVFLERTRQRDSDQIKKQLTVAVGIMIGALPGVFFLLSAQSENLSKITLNLKDIRFSDLFGFFTRMDDTFLFLLTGWPNGEVPQLLGRVFLLLVFGLLVFRYLKSPREMISIWLAFTYSAYFILTSIGFYAHGTFGFRYAQILTTLFVMAIVFLLIKLPFRPLAIGMSVLFLGITLYSLPNLTPSDKTRGLTSIWPEMEQIREVHKYWTSNRDESEATYIYYAAVPGFRYYQHQTNAESAELPTGWVRKCWAEYQEDICHNDGIVYGEWIHSRPVEEIIQSIQKAYGNFPDRIWIIFTHINFDEDQVILTGLRESYIIKSSYILRNASAYLLVRQ